MRDLNIREIDILNRGEGWAETLDLTCNGDTGHGPCGTYVDWQDGCCKNGHKIMIEDEDEE